MLGPNKISGLHYYQLSGSRALGLSPHELDSRALLRLTNIPTNKLKTAIQSRADALLVLRHPHFANKMKFIQMLEVAGSYPDLAKKILKSPLFAELTIQERVEFAKEDVFCAHYILDSWWCQNVDSYNLAKLGEKHIEIARRLVDDPLLWERIEYSDALELAGCHEELAAHIGEKLKIKHPLDIHDISVNICRHHLAMAKALLHDPEFLNQLRGYYLVPLSKYHLEIAWQIIQTPALCDILTSSELAQLGSKHYPIALHIFHTPHLYRKVANKQDLQRLGEKHWAIGQYILHHEQMKRIVNPQGRSLTGLDSKATVQYILDNQAHWSQMNLSVMTHFKDQQLAERMLDNEMICAKLHAHDLVDLGLGNLEITKRILNHPQLSTKLFLGGSSLIFLLGNSLPSIAKEMLDSRFATKVPQFCKVEFEKGVSKWEALQALFALQPAPNDVLDETVTPSDKGISKRRRIS